MIDDLMDLMEGRKVLPKTNVSRNCIVGTKEFFDPVMVKKLRRIIIPSVENDQPVRFLQSPNISYKWLN